MYRLLSGDAAPGVTDLAETRIPYMDKRYCLDTFGVDHILWGEDYPYRQKEDIRTFFGRI